MEKVRIRVLQIKKKWEIVAFDKKITNLIERHAHASPKNFLFEQK